ncbi:GNAT family N-acetyltransferase [Flavobacterium aquidurense]|uniref:GNAT family N-acetyltransferase n=1 Tax=Flavobacterium aquidurense TaxID=362413 RepID=UPI00285AA06A|nr:GNAT family N-acetyltransferase [Flavobacterium aquidurense]MDR7372910.1 ribosomal protein S18 acetylase RimI-like enzyme [Flavobacterium aquidurense]
MEYTIRNCEVTDLPKLVILCEKHAEFEKADYSPEGKEEGLKVALFSKEPKLFCLVVAVENDIVGYVSYNFTYSTWSAGDFLYMDCLYLEEESRSHGIGEVLINKLREIGKTKNCVNMQWRTPQFNERAIKFYHRMGAKGKDKICFFLDL